MLQSIKTMNKHFLIFSLLIISTLPALAQNKKPAAKAKKPAAEVSRLKLCHLPSDSSASTKLPLPLIQEWADDLPLKVLCNDGNRYSLNQFLFTIITMNPMQSKDFGQANNGIPILARKAIDKMKPGDTVFLKDVTGKDKDGQDVKLPNIIFVVKE